MSRLHPIEIPMHDEDEVVELSDGRLAREELSLRHGRNCCPCPRPFTPSPASSSSPRSMDLCVASQPRNHTFDGPQ